MEDNMIVKNNLIEQVTCKKCNNVIYREVEQYKIYTEMLKDEEKNLYAVFIKKFICPECGSKEYSSVLVEKTDQNLIDFNTIVKKKKNKKITVPTCKTSL